MGLDDFKTGSKDPKDIENDKLEPSGEGPQWLKDFSTDEWNSMSAEEKTKYVRQNYIDDYRPDLTPGDWEYQEAFVVKCSCDNRFVMYKKKPCPECGEKYEASKRAVVKQRSE